MLISQAIASKFDPHLDFHQWKLVFKLVKQIQVKRAKEGIITSS